LRRVEERRGDPIFYLTKEQQKEIRDWRRSHNREKHMETDDVPRNVGSIGGEYTYCITPTSLGEGVRVKCSCGEEIDVSHYENW